jgi:hypothetical protein
MTRADPFDGQPIRIRVELDGRHSPLFGELHDPKWAISCC